MLQNNFEKTENIVQNWEEMDKIGKNALFDKKADSFFDILQNYL